MIDPPEHIIIVRADIAADPGGLRVDIGRLSPSIAAAVLQRAVDALSIQPEPIVTVIHDGKEIAVTQDVAMWVVDDDDD